MGVPRRGTATRLIAAGLVAGALFLLFRPGTTDPADSGTTTGTAADTPVVGALFVDTGEHFCTASVVHSPGRNLAMTAAHCVSGGGDITFVPGFLDGRRPLGTWPVTRIIVDPAWMDSRDPDVDVGFLVLGDLEGQHIEDVVGANALGLDRGFERQVRMTGYPDERDAPITCAHGTERYSAHQLMIRCPGFTDGTSGGPWVTDADPATGLGTVIGVIGGFEEGGGTDGVSYSTYFDHRIGDLYQRAIAPPTADR
ncbi:trypsin-like serine protease [Longispora sp. K20-0274]|uniref:trypsin-like serine peptidase n=1 Tax=Longispora sp. K20-0274 TaxID=3088255 RepID=UPI00399A0174